MADKHIYSIPVTVDVDGFYGSIEIQAESPQNAVNIFNNMTLEEKLKGMGTTVEVIIDPDDTEITVADDLPDYKENIDDKGR